MQPYFEDSTVRLHHGDCIDVMASLPDNSVDAIVTDPPYGLGFMGKAWDDLPPGLPWAQECLRVLKPGGHLLAFGGTRTWHRLAVAVEDAGFEVRDSIAWLYGSGFPKSLDVSKAIDKAAGATRETKTVPAWKVSDYAKGGIANGVQKTHSMTAAKESGAETLEFVGDIPATPAAQQWAGWGTALKPAFEPIVVARKPLGGTVAANVLAHGTGALNIDGTRVASSEALIRPGSEMGSKTFDGFANLADLEAAAAIGGKCPNGRDAATTLARYHRNAGRTTTAQEPAGRWPTNVLLDGSQAEALDEQSGERPGFRSQTDRATSAKFTGVYGEGLELEAGRREGYNDTGGASRFFPTFRYQAKAPTRERIKVDGVAHPTVKPLALMQWLVRLVTPPGGIVLEPFAGSGTTVEAALLEGFRCIAIEREADYLPLIEARIARATSSPATDEDAPPTLFDATA